MVMPSPASTDVRYVSALSRLVGTCRESEIGFRRAVEDARSSALKDALTIYALQRARFAHELEIEIRMLGLETGAGSRVVSGCYRRSPARLAEPRSDAEIVKERLLGETAALGAFEEVIREDLPIDLETLLRVHHASIKGAREHLSRLGIMCQA
jgi:hypothetical protein